MRNVFVDNKNERITNIPRFQPELAYPVMNSGMLERIRKFALLEEKAPGSLLVVQGTVSSDLYVLLEGSALVFATDSSGERKVGATLHAGQFTGELDLLSSRPAMWSVEAAEACLVLQLPRPKVRLLMRDDRGRAKYRMALRLRGSGPERLCTHRRS